MRKTFTYMLIACFAALSLTSCKDDTIDFPESNWALNDYATSHGGTMILKFDGKGTLKVQNATSDTPPFDNTTLWDYWLEKDSTLYISYTSTDGENGVSTHTYDMELYLSNGSKTLTLVYVQPRVFRADETYRYVFTRR